MTLFEELKWRGLIKDVAGEDLKDKLNGEPITFYWGTDPTADSLHIGHYSSLVTAKRLMKAGHHPILLCGGATGRIGDPRPTKEREILDYAVIESNIKGIRAQIERLFDGKAELVDNYDWTKDYTFLEFLRDIGKYINVNYMINKDIISRRLETGITFAEFSYTLLQGYDFLHLYQTKNCIMQVEGSDQWGNITTGIELIKKKLGKEAYAFTMPLILDANGNKFGKSEGNALWLDKNKTTPYQIYQYLINADDSKVLEYLKVFTFLSKEEIEKIMEKQNEKPELRIAQKTLAYEVVKDIHGEEEAKKAIAMSEALFIEKFNDLTKEDIEAIFDKKIIVSVESTNLIDLVIEVGAAKSKREAREFITGGAIKINGEKITDLDYVLKDTDFMDNTYIIIKRGKKNYYVGKKCESRKEI
ncbi:MAG: tyrosine--tRNA ligase [Erysipelotrichaceae bacterium]|nr:tyrosine--tRNA ligase [Erysipelotrichaceae bacterium]